MQFVTGVLEVVGVVDALPLIWVTPQRNATRLQIVQRFASLNDKVFTV